MSAHNVVHSVFHLERTYDAPLARVWEAWTTEAGKAAWFGGSAGEATVEDKAFDIRPGGEERLKARWNSGTVSEFRARYFDVVDQSRLVYAYDLFLDGRKLSVSLATVEFEPVAGGTRLKVTEQGAFLDGYDDAGSREHGTGLLLGRLAEALEGAKPTPLNVH